MSELSPQLLEALDRYIDGQMSGDEHAAFERELEASASLRAARDEAMAWQRDLDASLRAQFSAASLALNVQKRPLTPGTPRSKNHVFPRWVPLVVAAGVGLVGLVSVYFIAASPSQVASAVRPTLAAVYNSTVDLGFTPEEVCTTRDKFADWLGTKFGVSLAIHEERADVTLVGWSYSTAISPYTGVLLAKSGDQPIIVVLDLKVRESGRGPPAVGDLMGGKRNLHVHKAVLHGLALYEISPIDTPRIIDNLERHTPGQ